MTIRARYEWNGSKPGIIDPSSWEISKYVGLSAGCIQERMWKKRREIGMTDYLTKPVKIQQIIE